MMSVGFGRDRRPGGSTPAPPPSVRHAGALFVPIGPDEFCVIASNDVQWPCLPGHLVEDYNGRRVPLPRIPYH
jgi:hypothetical protein